MLLEPLDRRADIHLSQMHHQVNRAATPFVEPPVEELGAPD
jgi:hypothetical protein